jgi:hypothetical protein
MSVSEVLIYQCEVDDKAPLRQFPDVQIWEHWLQNDPNHVIWHQIWAMLLHDLNFRTLAAAADADGASALHSPITRSGVVLGYTATQGLAIRRLVDMTKGMIYLRRLNIKLKIAAIY